ncbi:MAG: YicC/YloC family endoribonuclease [Acidobacteriota bacterium]
MALKSMTGYARARRANELGEAVATARSVNHRGLDLHVYVSEELEPFEPALRAAARRHVKRGHLSLRVKFTPAHAAAGAALNRPLFEAYLKALDEARRDYGVEGEPRLDTALRIPGMLVQEPGDAEAPEGLEALVVETAEQALAALDEFRAREGAELGRLLRDLNAAVLRDVEAVEACRLPAMEHYHARLEQRLRELTQGMDVDPQRVAQEAAILADKSDIAEEVGRLKVHVRELDAMLEAGGEVGKKLDFLMQEMSRETNTILSKTGGSGEFGLRVTSLALEIKANIERIREQALNLE